MERLMNAILRNKLIVYLVTCLLLIAGIGSLLSFQRELVPKTNLPWITVSIWGGSLPPEEMEQKITKPIEKEIHSLSNIKEFTSSSSTGRVDISVQAQEGKGTEVKQDLQGIVNRVRSSFPRDVKNAQVEQVNYGDDFLMALAVTGQDLPVMYNLATTEIKDRLEAVDGVKKAEIDDSNVNDKIMITLRPDQVAAAQTTPQSIVEQLQAANIKQALGILNNPGFDTVVELNQSFKTIQQIGEVWIQTGMGPIPLRQLADIQDLRGHGDAIFLKEGQPFLTIVLTRSADADVITTSDAVHQVIDAINQESQGQYEIANIENAARFVNNSVNNLSRDVLIGAALAILVLLLFLRNWRITLVISTTIPLSVMMTFISMKIWGYNIDMVSLLSLSLSVGLMVDAAIVVLESIYHFRETGYSLLESIRLGTREVLTPVLTSQLTIIIVFLPLMIVGLGGPEYKPIMQAISVIVTSAILASTVAALVFVPVYISTFLAKDKPEASGEKSMAERVTRFFSTLLEWALQHRKITVAAAIGLFVTSIALFPLVKTSTDISVDDSFVQARLIMPKGSTLPESNQLALSAAEQLKTVPEIQEIYTEAYKDKAVLEIKLKNKSDIKRDRETLMKDINQTLAGVQPVERFEVGYGSSGANTPVQLEIVGKEMETIQQLETQVQQMLQSVPGVRNPRSTLAESAEKITLVPRTEALQRTGVNETSLLMQISAILGEQSITSMNFNSRDIDVVARYPEVDMQHPEQLKRYMIRSESGSLVPLSDLVDCVYSKTPWEIHHIKGERVITVSAELAGSDLGSVGRSIEDRLREMNVPTGCSIRPAGALKQQKENLSDVLMTFLGTIALIYIIMVAQFGRLSHPFIILLSLPMAAVGVVVGLVITRQVVNPIGMVGFIMLIGIVVSNAILLIDRINLLRSRGYELRDAILEGARNRVRPILMTKLTAILGMLPLALAIGEGADLEAPLAIVVIFGLIFHTIITLVLVPVLYSLFEEWTVWWQHNVSKRGDMVPAAE